MAEKLTDYVVGIEVTYSPQAWAVSALLAGHGAKLLAAGVEEGKFAEPWRGAWAWVQWYLGEYSRIPSPARVTEKFPDTYLPDWDNRPVEDVLDVFYEDLELRLVRGAVVATGKLLTDGRTREAVEEYQRWGGRIADARTRVEIAEWRGEALKRLEKYQDAVLRAAAGEAVGVGIPLGIPTIDEASGGLLPGDYCIVAGRFDTAKTTLMTAMAKLACDAGTTGLFISPEMRAVSILGKMDAMALQVDPMDLRRGQLTADEAKRLEAVMREVAAGDAENYVVYGGGFSMGSIAVLTSYLKPKILYIDGLGFLKRDGQRNGRQADWLEMGLLSRGVKGFAVTHGLPVVVVHQSNRSSKSGGVKDNLSRSDIIGQDADILIEIESITDEMLRATLGKCRETRIRCSTYLKKVSQGLLFEEVEAPTMAIVDVEEFV
jgi:hypothetical protein